MEIRGGERSRIDGDMGIGGNGGTAQARGRENGENLLSRQLEIDGTLDDNRFRIESVHLEWPAFGPISAELSSRCSNVCQKYENH